MAGEKKTYGHLEKVGWKSPSNIALVKYWGKKPGQFPMNPSLSITLSESYTETILYFEKSLNPSSETKFSFLFEGKNNPEFSSRIKIYISSLHHYFPFLKEYNLYFESKNSFPHSVGIASSASSLSSIALCLCSMEQKVSSSHLTEEEFFRKASEMARLGSGSACRSVYGGFVSWGENQAQESTSAHFASKMEVYVSPEFRELNDAILVIDDTPKQVSSTEGHNLLNGHPYAESRFKQASANFGQLIQILQDGGFDKFAKVVEEEAMSIHAMMLTSNPSYCLIQPNTLSAIKKIKEWREKHKVPVCFTLDAGPNIHLIYPEQQAALVKPLIEELKNFCVNGIVLMDKVGAGPEKLF